MHGYRIALGERFGLKGRRARKCEVCVCDVYQLNDSIRRIYHISEYFVGTVTYLDISIVVGLKISHIMLT